MKSFKVFCRRQLLQNLTQLRLRLKSWTAHFQSVQMPAPRIMHQKQFKRPAKRRMHRSRQTFAHAQIFIIVNSKSQIRCVNSTKLTLLLLCFHNHLCWAYFKNCLEETILKMVNIGSGRDVYLQISKNATYLVLWQLQCKHTCI